LVVWKGYQANQEVVRGAECMMVLLVWCELDVC